MLLDLNMDWSKFIPWIEAHPVTIDACKWIFLIFIAWIAGAFRYLKSFFKKPSIEIVTDVSWCFIEQLDNQDNIEGSVRASFIIGSDVINPTSQNISVRYFRLRFSRVYMGGLYSKKMHAISLPARPRRKMGENYKMSKVFFTYYADGLDSLTMSGDLEPRSSQEGYLLFTSTTWGSWAPKLFQGKVKVELIAKLSTGETLKSRRYIRLTENRNFLDKFIPGLFEHIASEGNKNTYVNRGE